MTSWTDCYVCGEPTRSDVHPQCRSGKAPQAKRRQARVAVEDQPPGDLLTMLEHMDPPGWQSAGHE